jgi:hypothetical protein
MNESNLKKFVEFTKDLLNSVKDNPEYSWFVDLFNSEIINGIFKLQNTPLNPIANKFDAITEQDINRVKSYLNFIDRKAINYGKEFYKDIVDNALRRDLINDFKDMKIALINDDIIEFGRKLSLQIENMYNASLTNISVHKLINENKALYSKIPFKWSEMSNSYDYDFYKSFFYYDKEKRDMMPVELSKISFNTKSVFLLNYFNFKVNKSNLDDIYFLRNKGSHRDRLSEIDTEKLNKIFNRFDGNYSYYHKVLYEIKNNIKNI